MPEIFRYSGTRTRHAAAVPVTIVGAGPAGLSCAIVLARAGRRVIVREWHPMVGARFHGDFQGLESWSEDGDVMDELAGHGIDADFDHHPVQRGTAFDAWGAHYTVESSKPLFYLVHRGPQPGSLDQSLLRQARDAGAEVRFGDRVTDVVGPTVLAIGPRVADAIATGYVFETEMTDGCWVAFDDHLAPLGYAYLLVHGGRGTVTTCMFSAFKRHAEHLERTVAAFRERVGLEMRDPRPMGGFANFRLPRTAVQGGHLVLGEQAGFQDALAGFGMRFALRSGVLAARSLVEGLDYTRLWQRELLPLLRASVSNRYLFNTGGDGGRRVILRHRVSRGDARARLKRLYRPSLSKRIVFPLALWRYRAPLRDRSCDHVGCTCVWCRHGDTPATCAPGDRGDEPGQLGREPS